MCDQGNLRLMLRELVVALSDLNYEAGEHRRYPWITGAAKVIYGEWAIINYIIDRASKGIPSSHYIKVVIRVSGETLPMMREFLRSRGVSIDTGDCGVSDVVQACRDKFLSLIVREVKASGDSAVLTLMYPGGRE
ncbi:MAG: hypothetical protein ACP5NY_04030 [Thermocladium sp.]